MGTPEYVAPELIRGLKPDVRVDIYAVGVILYRLLTGRVPFSSESFMATLTQHLMEEVVPPRQAAPQADIPADLEAVVLRSLAKDRDARYADDPGDGPGAGGHPGGRRDRRRRPRPGGGSCRCWRRSSASSPSSPSRCGPTPPDGSRRRAASTWSM